MSQPLRKMRICPKCGHEIDDEKAEFCPRCGTQLPKELKELKAVEKTKLPLVGGALLMVGAVIYATVSYAVPYPYGYMSFVLVFVLIIGFLLVPLSIFKRRNYGTLVGFAVVTLFLEFWTVFSSNSYYYYEVAASANYGVAMLGFFITLIGAFSIAAARQEFFE